MKFRWRLVLSWLCGAAPIVAMVPAQDVRTRLCIFVLGIGFVLASMGLAQWDGMERDSDIGKPLEK